MKKYSVAERFLESQYSQQAPARETIIFGRPVDWKAERKDIIYFAGLNPFQLQRLMESGERIITPAVAPSLEYLLEFGRKYPQSVFSGFVISPAREDTRATIDGIAVMSRINSAVIKDFKNAFSRATVFQASPELLNAWWD